jgi:hypothetical protein
MEAFQRVAELALQVDVSTASAVASNLDPTLGEECWKTDLEVVSARSLHPMVAKIQLQVVVTTWKVDWPWEILPMTSWVHDYSENPVTVKIELCLII